jgi:hypothetical protein
MPKGVKVKVRSTGNVAIVTPRAYELQDKLFVFIANVQVDEDGNEIQPVAAPKAEPKTLQVSTTSDEESPNAQTTGSESGVAPVVVSAGRKPGRKSNPQ